MIFWLKCLNRLCCSYIAFQRSVQSSIERQKLAPKPMAEIITDQPPAIEATMLPPPEVSMPVTEEDESRYLS